MKTIGIDIGSFSVKVAECEGHTKYCLIKSFYEIELNHELGRDNRLEIIEALRRVIVQFDPADYKYVVGMGSEHVANRILNLPFVERKKIAQTLPAELEESVPFSQEDSVSDFRVIHHKESSSQILGFATPKKYVKEVLDLCHDAGLDPDIITPEGVALHNLFEDPFSSTFRISGDAQTVVMGAAEMVIHIGYSKTIINVTRSGALVASRACFFGAKDLIQLVSRNYQLPFFEAMKAVTEKGFVLTDPSGADQNQVAFSQVISQGLGILVTEINRTLIEIKSELETMVQSGRIMGGLSGLINLGPYLTREVGVALGVQTELATTFKSMIPDDKRTSKVAAMAIGLALEGQRKPKNPPINMRRGEFAKEGHSLKFFVEKFKPLLITMGVVLFIFYVYAYLKSSILTSNVESMDQAVNDYIKKNKTLGVTKAQLAPAKVDALVREKRAEIEGKKELVRYNKYLSGMDILKKISVSVPGKNKITLDIRTFDLEGEALTMEGMVNSVEEFGLLRKALVQTPLISQVQALQATVGAPRGKYPFKISLNISRLPFKEAKTK